MATKYVVFEEITTTQAVMAGSNCIDPTNEEKSLFQLLAKRLGIKHSTLNQYIDQGTAPQDVAKKIKLLAGPNGKFIAKMLKATQ